MTAAVGILLTIATVAIVAYPFLRGKEGRETAENDHQRDIATKKELAAAVVTEAEFDHEVGNLSDDEYQRLRAQYTGVAPALAKEEVQPAQAADMAHKREEPVEREVAQEVSTAGGTKREQTEVRFCSRCGTRLQKGAKFCNQCGTKIKGVVE